MVSGDLANSARLRAMLTLRERLSLPLRAELISLRPCRRSRRIVRCWPRCDVPVREGRPVAPGPVPAGSGVRPLDRLPATDRLAEQHTPRELRSHLTSPGVPDRPGRPAGAAGSDAARPRIDRRPARRKTAPAD